MKVLRAEFMEPVKTPTKGAGPESIDRFVGTDAGPLRCRAQGPGLLLEVDGKPQVTIVPWGNVRFVLAEVEEGDTAAKGKVKG